MLWVGFRKDTLVWTGPGGEPTWYSTWPTLHRGFCPRCGTHLISVADGSEMTTVTAFSLDDRSGTDPVGHSYREEAAPWMIICSWPCPVCGPRAGYRCGRHVVNRPTGTAGLHASSPAGRTGTRQHVLVSAYPLAQPLDAPGEVLGDGLR